MQEADRDRGDAEFAEPARGRLHRGLVERQLDAAVEAHALRHLEAQPPRHQRRRILDAQVEQVVAALEAHIEDVAEARGRQHAGHGAAALDHGVGDERRAVHDVADVADARRHRASSSAPALDDGLGRIVRRGQPLVHRHPSPRASNSAKSVKVPPMSTPMRYMRPRPPRSSKCSQIFHTALRAGKDRFRCADRRTSISTCRWSALSIGSASRRCTREEQLAMNDMGTTATGNDDPPVLGEGARASRALRRRLRPVHRRARAGQLHVGCAAAGASSTSAPGR